jgi:nitrate reductase NapAB chaperone NapD
LLLAGWGRAQRRGALVPRMMLRGCGAKELPIHVVSVAFRLLVAVPRRSRRIVVCVVIVRAVEVQAGDDEGKLLVLAVQMSYCFVLNSVFVFQQLQTGIQGSVERRQHGFRKKVTS